MAVMYNYVRSLILLAGMALLGLPLVAQSETPLPVIPEASSRFSDAQGCVEPTEEMRKDHMEYILHQRDKTMHEGIRTRQYSLEECINCHVPGDDSGKVVRIDSTEHFCNSCHSYAAVNIDCFQCHSDRPVRKTGMSSPVGGNSLDYVDAATAENMNAGTPNVLAAEGNTQ